MRLAPAGVVVTAMISVPLKPDDKETIGGRSWRNGDIVNLTVKPPGRPKGRLSTSLDRGMGRKRLIWLVQLVGVEPTTFGSTIRRSSQLSYSCMPFEQVAN